ncbi:MAG: hypothetical protein JRJ41_04070 [Deltaproteobacteria bacterium]|nr:hypothetical protein [Deltaproteobacteria bacterium]
MNLNNTTRKESNITCHFIFSTPIGDITVVYNPQPFTVKTIFLLMETVSRAHTKNLS